MVLPGLPGALTSWLASLLGDASAGFFMVACTGLFWVVACALAGFFLVMACVSLAGFFLVMAGVA